MARIWTPLAAALVCLGTATAPVRADHRELRTLEMAADTIHALGDIPFRGIPQGLLRDARGVAIIPNVVKAGLVVDGRFGRGVVLARQPDGSWGNPVFITLSGGGIGVQAGVESTDVVLVFRTAHSVDRFLSGRGKLTLGGDVAIAAGPLGREAEAATDARLKAEIWSYSRSRGLFAGASLAGAAILIDHKSHEAFYSPHSPDMVAREVAALAALKGRLTQLSGPPNLPPAVVVPVAPPGPPAPVVVPPAPTPPVFPAPAAPAVPPVPLPPNLPLPLSQTSRLVVPEARSWTPYGTLRKTTLLKGGQPVYVLVDNREQPVCFVTTEPGTTVESFVNRLITVYGRPVSEAGGPAGVQYILASHIAAAP